MARRQTLSWRVSQRWLLPNSSCPGSWFGQASQRMYFLPPTNQTPIDDDSTISQTAYRHSNAAPQHASEEHLASYKNITRRRRPVLLPMVEFLAHVRDVLSERHGNAAVIVAVAVAVAVVVEHSLQI